MYPLGYLTIYSVTIEYTDGYIEHFYFKNAFECPYTDGIDKNGNYIYIDVIFETENSVCNNIADINSNIISVNKNNFVSYEQFLENL